MGRRKAVRTQDEKEEFQRLKRERIALNQQKYRDKEKENAANNIAGPSKICKSRNLLNNSLSVVVSESPSPLVVKNVCVSSVMKLIITTSTLSSSVTTVNNCMSKLQSNSALTTPSSRFDNNNVNIIKRLSTVDEVLANVVENTTETSQSISVNVNDNISRTDNEQLLKTHNITDLNKRRVQNYRANYKGFQNIDYT